MQVLTSDELDPDFELDREALDESFDPQAEMDLRVGDLFGVPADEFDDEHARDVVWRVKDPYYAGYVEVIEGTDCVHIEADKNLDPLDLYENWRRGVVVPFKEHIEVEPVLR